MTNSKPPLRPYAPLNIPNYDTFFRPVDAPGSDPLDPDYVCVRFNEDWLPYVLGALARLEFEDTWKGDPAAQSEAIGHARNLIAIFASATKSGCFEGVDDMRLRQKPGEPCVLQASYDGGDSWSDVFDYAACMAAIGQTTRITNTYTTYELQQIINNGTQRVYELRDQYDGTPGSIAPDMVYGAPSGNVDDTLRDAVLCYACNYTIDALCESMTEIIANQTSQVGIAVSIAGAIAGIAVALAAPPVGMFVFLGFAYSTIGTLASTARVIGVEIFDDPDVRADVACCMYNALKGSTVEKSDFQAALSGDCGFPFGSSASQIAGFFNDQVMDSDDLYLVFLETMQTGIPYVELGLYTCPCDDWQINRLNGAGNADLTPFLYAGYSDGTQCVATYDAVNDRYESCYSGGSRRASGTAIRWNFANIATVTGVTVRVTNQDNGSSNDMIQVFCYDALDQIVDSANKPGDGDLVDAVLDAPNTSYMLIYCRSYASSGTPAANIDEIILTGNGDSPF